MNLGPKNCHIILLMHVYTSVDVKCPGHTLTYHFLPKSMKEGTTVFSKDNKVMQFKIPKVIVVFSNHMSYTGELSKTGGRYFRL